VATARLRELWIGWRMKKGSPVPTGGIRDGGGQGKANDGFLRQRKLVRKCREDGRRMQD
jgi:hypothetical protein